MRNLQIEFIYTYESYDQDIKRYPFVLPILQDEETLLEFALNELVINKRIDLLKISCCIYGLKDPTELPEWYLACKGKIYFDEN